MHQTRGDIKPKMKEEIKMGSPLSFGDNLDTQMYECQMDNYRVEARELWSIEGILKGNIKHYFLVRERKVSSPSTSAFFHLCNRRPQSPDSKFDLPMRMLCYIKMTMDWASTN